MHDIIRLSAEDRRELIRDLVNTQHEFLIAYDDIDDAIKWKVDGTIWSPPMGTRAN